MARLIRLRHRNDRSRDGRRRNDSRRHHSCFAWGPECSHLTPVRFRLGRWVLDFRWRFGMAPDWPFGRLAASDITISIGILQNTQKICPAVPTTVCGDAGEQLLLPLDSQGGSNRNRRSQPKACPGRNPGLDPRWSMVSSSVLVFPPHFGSCQRERLGIGIPVRQTGLSTAPGFIPLNSHQKCHSIAAAVSGHSGKLLPLPPNRELRPNLDGSLDSDADPEGRRVLDPGGSKVRCAGFVFPANLSHSHHGSSGLADRNGMVHDFFYIGIKNSGA